MPKYEVVIHETTQYLVEVVADSPDTARLLGEEKWAMCPNPQDTFPNTYIGIDSPLVTELEEENQE